MRKDKPFAYWISQIGSPPVMGLVGAILCIFALRTGQGVLWTSLYILLSILAPTGYLFWLFRRGKITDIHLKVRGERIIPTLATIAGTVLALIIVTAVGAPELLLILVMGQLIHMVIFLAITIYWQISIHCSTAATIAMFAGGAFGGITAVFFVALIPVIGWSRVTLERHTIPQTVLGTLLGTVAMVGAFILYSGA